MATLVEATVRASVEFHRDEDGNPVMSVRVASFDAAGTPIRSRRFSAWSLLSAARQTGALALLDDIEAYARSQWGMS